MKDYNLKNYDNLQLFKADLLAGLNEDFADLEVSSPTYTDCEILEFIDAIIFDNQNDVEVAISCNAGIKSFCIRKSISNGIIVFPGDKQELIIRYFDAYDSVMNDYKAQQAEERRLALLKHAEESKLQEARREKIRLAKEQKELELKAQKKVAHELKKFNELKYAKNRIRWDLKDSMYATIGWVAKHTKSISVAMPDFLEQHFVDIFGDVNRKVVNSKKKGPAGYTSQWGLSMALILDTDTDIPAALTPYMSKGKTKANVVSKLDFVYALLEDYGFKVGAEQNADEIKATIPQQYLADFELGYNA